MRLVVTLESRLDQTPDGAVWGDGVFAGRFWDTYWEVFDALRIVARLNWQRRI